MIKYSLPENKPYKETVEVAPDSLEEHYYRPCIYLEISPEQLKALTVGDEIEVKVKGKVKGLEMRERESGKSRHELDLEVSEVSVPSKNVFEQMADEELD